MRPHQFSAVAFLTVLAFMLGPITCGAELRKRPPVPTQKTGVVTNVSHSVGSSCFPELQADVDGNVHLVWIDGANDLGVFYSRWTEGSWTQPLCVSGEGAVCVTPSMAVERSGKVHLTWMTGDQFDCDVYYSQLVDGTWTKPTNISNLKGVSQCPQITVDPSGTIHIIWYDNANGHLELFHSQREGTEWSTAANTNLVTWKREDDPEMLANCGLIADSRNHLHLVWVDADGEFQRIFHSSWDGKSWSRPQSISPKIEGPSRLTLQRDASDQLHLAWQQHFSEVWYCCNSDGNWTEPTVVSHSAGWGQSGLPAMCISPSGQVHIAWTCAGDDLPQIFARRFHDGTWSESEQVTHDPNGALFPAVAIDASGATHFAWVHLSLTNTDIHHSCGIPNDTNPIGESEADLTSDFAFYARGDIREFISPAESDDQPQGFKMVQPRGEFVKIEIATTNELLQRLLHADQAVREQALDDFLAAPEQYAPPAHFAAAFAMFEAGRKQQALFWYDAGLLRASSDAYKSGDPSAQQVVYFLIDKFGPPFHELNQSNWRHTAVVMNKAIEWDRQHERNYDQRWIALQGMDALSNYQLRFAPRDYWDTINDRARLMSQEDMADVTRAAEEADANHDGKLNKEEMEAYQTASDRLSQRRQLARRYQIDGDVVTYQGRLIDGAQAATFEVLKNPHYAKDETHVYVMGHEIPGADPKTFTCLKGPYGKDNSSVYWGVVPMTVHDRDDFEVVYWEREWLTYYHNTPQIVQASEFGETISSGRWISTSIAKIGLSDAQRGVIGLAWARDGQAYYFGPAAVEGADYPSFEVINAGLAKDKNRTYEGAFAK